jgi:hypothetical protein
MAVAVAAPACERTDAVAPAVPAGASNRGASARRSENAEATGAEAKSVAAQSAASEGDEEMTDMSAERADLRVRLVLDDDTTLSATLVDSPAARDFLAMLPLDLTLRDYASTEKISELPRRLSTEGAPAGVDPDVGDITYYAPWGNLAIFYRDFGYADGLVKLGSIDAGVEALARRRGAFAARLERAGGEP